ncbi:MAG: MFS transporter, partial [Dehalococcoidia bacterium]|nr:MFS transporter [Dehalococcoidia bacterium]
MKMPNNHGSERGKPKGLKGPSGAPYQAVAGIPLPWFITIVAATLLFVMSANPYSFGVFFKPISEQFGWSRGALSGAYALRSLVAAVLVAPVGYWSDVSGPRRPLLLSFLLTGVGFLLISRATTLWQMYLVQGVVMVAGAAAPWSCLAGAVGKWHDRARVTAM